MITEFSSQSHGDLQKKKKGLRLNLSMISQFSFQNHDYFALESQNIKPNFWRLKGIASRHSGWEPLH